MQVAIGGDHAGFELKQAVGRWLEQAGHTVVDVGTDSSAPVDYPDIAETVCRSILSIAGERGILICGSGVGASIAANKIPGIRAGLCHDVYSAHQGVEHDDMNVLVLGARVIGEATALELAQAFLGAKFTGEPRHRRRLDKVIAIEQRYGKGE